MGQGHQIVDRADKNGPDHAEDHESQVLRRRVRQRWTGQPEHRRGGKEPIADKVSRRIWGQVQKSGPVKIPRLPRPQ